MFFTFAIKQDIFIKKAKRMKKLTIHHIGPIKHVELTLKRINVVIGPQSAGKSCILKIACFCAWAEKRIQLEQGKNGFADFEYVKENLLAFHKLRCFLHEDSSIEYKSDFLSFTIDFAKETFNLRWGNAQNRFNYKRPRVSYIPAERNLVSSIPNWFDVKMDSTNLKSFIADWAYAHKLCGDEAVLPVLNLNVGFFYDKQTDHDYILLGDDKRMELSDASSGLQSVIPMWVYLDYLFRKQYSPNEMLSSKTETENEEIAQHIYESKFKNAAKQAGEEGNVFIGKFGLTKRVFASKEDFEDFKQLVSAYTQTSHSDIYLEEPEQNLFPLTQVELVYELLKNTALHNDNLFIATHSPYILYALNSCMLGYKVKDKIPTTVSELREHESSWVNPKDVAVWEIHDGEFSSMVDKKNMTLQDADGLIRGNYFDRVMKLIMTDFSNYSTFYD